MQDFKQEAEDFAKAIYPTESTDHRANRSRIIKGYIAAAEKHFPRWISVDERLPELVEGQNYSENVWAIVEGILMVMCYCRGFGWCNCYGNIDGEGHYDDEYNVTQWMNLTHPLPSSPLK